MSYAENVTGSNEIPGSQRRTVLIALVVVGVVLAAVAVWAVAAAGGSDRAMPVAESVDAADGEPTAEADADPADPEPTDSDPAESDSDAAPQPVQADPPAAPEPPTTVVNGVEVPEEDVAPPVSFEEPVEIAAFSAAVLDIRAIEGVGQGIGEISGPALAFTIEITNNTQEVLETLGAVVNVYDSTKAPAIPLLGDPNAKPLPARIAPGETATGTYVFRVAPELRDDLTMTVAFDPEFSVVAFSGAAG